LPMKLGCLVVSSLPSLCRLPWTLPAPRRARAPGWVCYSSLDSSGAGAMAEASTVEVESRRVFQTESARSLGLELRHIRACCDLFEDGMTVPFIVRYRASLVGGMSGPQAHDLDQAWQRHGRLAKTRTKVLSAMEASGALTPGLRQAVLAASTDSALDDLYAPFKPQPKGSLAHRAKALPGLEEAVAEFWSRGDPGTLRRLLAAAPPPDSLGKGDMSVQSGAMYLVAQRVAEQPRVWHRVQTMFEDAAIVSTGKLLDAKKTKQGAGTGGEGSLGAKGQVPSRKRKDTFAEYESFSQRAKWLRPHQVLALARAEDAGHLKVSISVDSDRALDSILRETLAAVPARLSDPWSKRLLRESASDAWSRLLKRRGSTWLWRELLGKARDRSITVFCDNVIATLLARPLTHPRPVLALDPGFAAGIKCATLSSSGQVQRLFSLHPLRDRSKARMDLADEIRSVTESSSTGREVPLVIVGDGHGSQEARELLGEAIAASAVDRVDVSVVSESGASVWSATAAAAEEFPNTAPAAIAAVSIGRRGQDPLSELVKIPPKSLGVGMYQHDLPEKELDAALDRSTVDAVALVGVDVDRASKPLLAKVPGLTSKHVEKIIASRPFSRRQDLLMRVKGFGPKAFQNAAGFLRVYKGGEPLDATMVHPEDYDTARELLASAWSTAPDKSKAKSASNAGALVDWFQDQVRRLCDNPTSASTLETWIQETVHGVTAPTDEEAGRELLWQVMEQLIASSFDPRLLAGGVQDDVLLRSAAHDSRGATPNSSTSRAAALARRFSKDPSSGTHGAGSSTPAGAPLSPELAASLEALRDASPIKGVSGVVKTVTDFGAFVDLGAETNGLLHVSKLGPQKWDGIFAGARIVVDVETVDVQRRRVGLARAGLATPGQPGRGRQGASSGGPRNHVGRTGSNRGSAGPGRGGLGPGSNGRPPQNAHSTLARSSMKRKGRDRFDGGVDRKKSKKARPQAGADVASSTSHSHHRGGGRGDGSGRKSEKKK